MTLRPLSVTIPALFVVLSLLNGEAQAAGPSTSHFKAVAFDYFVIFDPNSVVPEVEKAFPGKGVEFTKAWRSKQFEYSFLRSITSDHEDFFKVTGDALDYTAEQMHEPFDVRPANSAGRGLKPPWQRPHDVGIPRSPREFSGARIETQKKMFRVNTPRSSPREFSGARIETLVPASW